MKKMGVAVSSFEELGLSEEVLGALKEMGISMPMKMQCIGVPAVLEGKSVVLGSHTGSGKTLAYMLPLVQLVSSKTSRKILREALEQQQEMAKVDGKRKSLTATAEDFMAMAQAEDDAV